MSEGKDAGNSDRAALDLLIRGFQLSRMLRLVADLGLADRIDHEGDRSVADLAADCEVQPLPLLRILRALAAFGVFSVGAGDRIGHTPRSLLLRTDVPGSMHHGARFWTAPGSWRAWEALDAALAGGVPHEAAWGVGRFQYLREHPQEARQFDDFMAHFPDDRHAAIAAAYDFPTTGLIVDVGGGNGETLRHVLARFPQARGLVFDRPDVVAAIPADRRMEGSIDVLGGSFLDGAPAGADIYLLVRVLHDWSDDDCVRILRHCRDAMTASSRLLVVEQLLEPDPTLGPKTIYLLDTQMLAMFGTARERTQAEFDALFAASGLATLRTLGTPAPVHIIEAARL